MTPFAITSIFFAQVLDISPEIGCSLTKGDTGVYFDWAPDNASYVPYIDTSEPSRGEPWLGRPSAE
jgi:hypothetical protein